MTMNTKQIQRAAAVALAVLIGGLNAAPAHADDPAFIALSGGTYDWNLREEEGHEFRLEYRHDKKILGIFKPFIAAAVTTTGSSFLGAGLLTDIYMGQRVVVTPSLAPHLYRRGSAKMDLGSAIEFRSQVEVAYRFDDRSRLGFALSHYSNGGMGDTNHGTESAMLTYVIPLSKVIGE